ncbi:MAG: response regulator [Candidatus Helarchaeota archaeon]|nr:response regulator [Candidatus Helarchaeota archaeon]
MKTILVVEDEKPIQLAISAKLAHEGFGVLQASDGEMGLSIALEKHPDLILLDIVMPKMDGMTVLKKLRQDDWGKNVPILVLTNLSDDVKINQSISNNVFDYLIKTNWKLEDVVHKVKETLQLHNA